MLKKVLPGLGTALLLFALFFSVGLHGAAGAVYEPETEITEACLITDDDNSTFGKLLDHDYSTMLRYSRGASITVKSPEEIRGLYLIWNRPPGAWTLETAGETRTYGAEGFLHEFIPLEGIRSLTITLPAEGAQLCDLCVFGEGDLPDWVQIWEPPLEKADMLVVSTHSDDELIFFGGLLPTYAGERGYRVQVAYLNSHWKEAVRPHELLNGLWTVGVTNYPAISDMDDWNAYAGHYSIGRYEEFEVMLLRRFRPEVVVTQDLKGEYGHPSHIMTATAMLTAAEKAADPEAYPETAAQYGTWQVKKHYIHMYAEGQLTMDWHIPLRAFDGLDALEVDTLGYGCHYSQHHLVFNIHEEGSGDCRLFGLYSSLVGEDTEADFMCNTGISPQRGTEADLAAIAGEEQ